MVARFDELESEVRRRAQRDAAAYLPNLQEMFAQARQREAPPPHTDMPVDLKNRPPKSWMRRPGSLEPLPPYSEPQDPSVDTFDQRFAPDAPQNQKERQYQVPPGYRERYGDPTKVIADASGRIPATGKKSDEQPYHSLPPGFKFVDDEKPLPPGFKFVDEGPPPVPNAAITAGYGSVPEDPFERAALRQQQGVMPAQKRAEGATTRALEGVVPAAQEMALRGMQVADIAMKEGDLPPQQAMDAAMMMNPTSAAFKTGGAIANFARPRGNFSSRNVPDPMLRQQQLETGVMSIPAAAVGSQTSQNVGRAVSSLPVIGSRLRNVSETATKELQAAGEAAAARPTGEAVAQDVAGGRVRGALAGLENAPDKFKAIVKGSNEDAIGAIIKMAGSKQGADATTLAQLRRYVPVESHGEVQSAIISRLGRGPATGEFDSKTWLRNYANLSDRGKNILFGKEGGDLRRHLDAIEAVSRRAPTWQQFTGGRTTTGTAFGVGGLILGAVGAYHDPLKTLEAAIPLYILSRGLSRPATAAPIAQWSRAYERVIRSKGGPQAIATFSIATRNLNNSLGTEVNPVAILRGQDEQPVE